MFEKPLSAESQRLKSLHCVWYRTRLSLCHHNKYLCSKQVAPELFGVPTPGTQDEYRHMKMLVIKLQEDCCTDKPVLFFFFFGSVLQDILWETKVSETEALSKKDSGGGVSILSRIQLSCPVPINLSELSFPVYRMGAVAVPSSFVCLA